MTGDEHDFLRRLTRHPTPRKNLPIADRAEDRVRQACRRKGWAQFVGGWLDGKKYPMGWAITDLGMRALERNPE